MTAHPPSSLTTRTVVRRPSRGGPWEVIRPVEIASTGLWQQQRTSARGWVRVASASLLGGLCYPELEGQGLDLPAADGQCNGMRPRWLQLVKSFLV